MSLSDEQRLDWLRLIRTEGVGPRTFQSLINRFGSARAALDALPDVSRRAGRPVAPCSMADAEREMLAARRIGVRFIALGEAEYPAALQAIDSAPPLLGVRGNLAVLRKSFVGIVGSRNASALGLKFTHQLARALGEADYAIASGLARGIDTAAHESSLETGTVAVLAGGPDYISPAQNEALFHRILDHGAAISEMPVGYEPRARDFPRRNRIVSGLSLGTVVVEAAKGSGSLITARFALEQGREVFAVPGSPLDPRAAGTNALIRDGATLCCEAAHVIEALQPQLDLGREAFPAGRGFVRDPGQTRQHEQLWDELPLVDVAEPPFAASGEQEWTSAEEEPASFPQLRSRLLQLVGPTPVMIDDLIREIGDPPRHVQMALMELELDGLVLRHAGQRVSRTS
ncbi:MAG: DNA-processing protein DprA [Bosea sp. (in: a-proteobacteria)]